MPLWRVIRAGDTFMDLGEVKILLIGKQGLLCDILIIPRLYWLSTKKGADGIACCGLLLSIALPGKGAVSSALFRAACQRQEHYCAEQESNCFLHAQFLLAEQA